MVSDSAALCYNCIINNNILSSSLVRLFFYFLKFCLFAFFVA